MDTALLFIRLNHIVTKHDQQQQRSKYYNPFALAIYLEGVERVASMVENGADLSDAINSNFNDKLAAKLLKVKI
jgi:hypothetical protein